MKEIRRSSFVALVLACFAASASAGNVIQNSDFGIGAGTLANWDVVESFDGQPAPGYVTTSSLHSHSTRFSCHMQENFTFSPSQGSIRQDFGPVTNVQEVSLYALSFTQHVKTYLYYTDNTFDVVTTLVQSADTDDWKKIDVTADVDPLKTLNGIKVAVNAGSFDDGNEIYLDDITVNATPVPEPATMATLGLGALALLRKKRKA